MMKRVVRFSLNGDAIELGVDVERPLLWVLRADLGLTGTKYGCGEGLCGACSVLVDGEAVRSCRTAVMEIEGGEVTTIEGLAREGELHPLQEAFVEHDALQCGFCTPGMVIGAYSLLLSSPSPSVETIVEHMEDHLCRCGSYGRVVQAIRSAAQGMKGAKA